MKAVNVSYDNSGPWIGPDIFASTLQLVPNWNPITTPDTTPRPNAMPNILSQNSKTTRYTGSFGPKVHRLENGEPGGYSNRERRENDVERDGEGELYP